MILRYSLTIGLFSAILIGIVLNNYFMDNYPDVCVGACFALLPFVQFLLILMPVGIGIVISIMLSFKELYHITDKGSQSYPNVKGESD